MPSEFVVVTVTTPVCTLVIVTRTPGTTAPEESETVPLISPVLAFCPTARPVKTRASRRPMRPKRKKNPSLIAEPPTIDSPSESTPQIILDSPARTPSGREWPKPYPHCRKRSQADLENLRIRQKLE